jgi:pyruvate carboxylase
MLKINKLLVANRSEIAIRVFRTATELGIRTVAIYAHEDRYALHRFRADEAYQVGKEGEPIKSYLNIDNIIAIAKQYGVDAIHPGYGFLSENPALAEACAANNIIFIGPSLQALQRLGDKTAARAIATAANVPILVGSEEAVHDGENALAVARSIGFPIILKAAHGGGGRGMRVVAGEEGFQQIYEQARRESLNAFNSPDIFVEKFIEHARHIEVQIMGDQHGNLVHLYERDCSVQRRHQKVVEIAPAPALNPEVRDGLCQAALAIGQQVGYSNAGTVEFLVDADSDRFYFIEVNPRIQVEHTVTEEVTGLDIVRCQILAAAGYPLNSEEIGLGNQNHIKTNGFAIQCRITAEDPLNNFMPDYGRVTYYRSSGGPGIRLDTGTAFSGAMVTPYYDSMLVKVTARGGHFIDAVNRMQRVLNEFRIRGVKTNIHFLENLLGEEQFRRGECTTRYIDQTPHLFKIPQNRDRASKLLHFIGSNIVNGNPLVLGRQESKRRIPALTPPIENTTELPRGSRDIFLEKGAEGFAKWTLEQPQLFITDTTFRDAHQSLLATRLRTYDMLKIAPAYAHLAPNLFSLEMWGGATFDTTMRFLKESPWQRLEQIREAVPNIMLQMLLRASSAVGYANYPDNVVKAFIQESARSGIDIFRIFDALNWLPNMKLAMESTIEAGAVCEASICYSGDLSNPKRDKYNLKYYIKLAKELQQMGAHILAIKDMAGLCKPQAAKQLVKALKEEVGLPIHFHTHDTSGIAAASILSAVEAGVDIVDTAMAPFSGGTSQANLNTLVESLRFDDRDCQLDTKNLDAIADYWRSTRDFYTPLESAVLPATADLYHHEIPGGQYTNLYEQARALGLVDQWTTICNLYADVNQMLGDIIKVTPTSKAVGDMALFMVANDLTVEKLLSSEQNIDFPASVIDLVSGMMGQPYGGFPEKVKQLVLKRKSEVKGRPGDTLPPADFAAAEEQVTKLTGEPATQQQILSYLLYPKVFEEYAAHEKAYVDTSILPTPVFFYGLQPEEELAISLKEGKTIIIKYMALGNQQANGTRTVYFELNGIPREVMVEDSTLEQTAKKRVEADPNNPAHIGAPMPGMVVKVMVEKGKWVKAGDVLLVLEAMKMETTLHAERDGKLAELLVQQGQQVENGELMMVVE